MKTPMPVGERPETTARVRLPDDWLPGALVGLALAVLWIRPIGSSLWLDELGTYWIVRRSLSDAIDLSWRFAGQSPAYYVIAWVARVLGRGNEIILRLPSLAAAGTATFLLARLAKRLFGSTTAWPSAVVFAVTPIVAFSAIDARPYAFAYLALAGATLTLVILLQDGGYRWSIAYGICAASVIYFHYLFGFALLGHVPYALVHGSGRKRYVSLGAAIGSALVAPLAGQVARLVERGRIPDLPLATPTPYTLLTTLLPLSVAVGAMIGWLIARFTAPLRVLPQTETKGGLLLSASMWLAPSLGLLTLALLSGINLLWPTYTRSSAVGLALLLGSALGSLEPEHVRRIVLTVIVIVGLLATGGTRHHAEDWRGAAQKVDALVTDESTPVLVHPAFIESAHVPFLMDPEYRSALLAPLARYPVRGSVILMPYDLTDRTKPYLETVVVPAIERADRFVLFTLSPTIPFREWLDGRLAPLGFRSRLMGEYAGIQVILFERET